MLNVKLFGLKSHWLLMCKTSWVKVSLASASRPLGWSPTGTMQRKPFVWRPSFRGYGNGYVLICIFAPFLTQYVLKPQWPWTYHNFAVKRAYERVVPRWVASWKVLFWGVKANNIVSLSVGYYKWYQSHCLVWDGGACTSPWGSLAGTH
jgi:hypothetical protein